LSDKKVFLIRHAHRDVMDRLDDNGLSLKGREQSRLIKKFFKRKDLTDKKILILTSPKLRCIETLLPLSEKLDIDLEVQEIFDEQTQNESFKDFEKRVENSVHTLINKNAEVVFVCSHGDFIPSFLERAVNQSIQLKKGALVELLIVDQKYKLIQVIQSL